MNGDTHWDIPSMNFQTESECANLTWKMTETILGTQDHLQIEFNSFNTYIVSFYCFESVGEVKSEIINMIDCETDFIDNFNTRFPRMFMGYILSAFQETPSGQQRIALTYHLLHNNILIEINRIYDLQIRQNFISRPSTRKR